MRPHGARHKYVPHARQTCRVCGRENVAHKADGEPFRVHVETKGHQEALARAAELALERGHS